MRFFVKHCLVGGLPAEMFLTDECAESSHGIPVLGLKFGSARTYFGPRDGGAAEVVAKYGSDERRTRAQRDLAALFCRQWPEGPQVVETERTKRIASELERFENYSKGPPIALSDKLDMDSSVAALDALYGPVAKDAGFLSMAEFIHDHHNDHRDTCLDVVVNLINNIYSVGSDTYETMEEVKAAHERDAQRRDETLDKIKKGSI